jgi:hypothetical protein
MASQRFGCTGADLEQQGFFRSAIGATLLLDETGEPPFGCRRSASAEPTSSMPDAPTRRVHLEAWPHGAAKPFPAAAVEAVCAGRSPSRRQTRRGSRADRPPRRGRLHPPLGYDISLTRACIGPIRRHVDGVPRGPAVTAPPPLLEVVDLVKDFGAFRALDGVSLRMAPGRMHAVLGENGAGKSTLVKCVISAEIDEICALAVPAWRWRRPRRDPRARPLASPRRWRLPHIGRRPRDAARPRAPRGRGVRSFTPRSARRSLETGRPPDRGARTVCPDRRLPDLLGSPISAYSDSRNDAHHAGMLSSVRTQFMTPKMSMPAASNASGAKARAAPTM